MPRGNTHGEHDRGAGTDDDAVPDVAAVIVARAASTASPSMMRAVMVSCGFGILRFVWVVTI